MRQLNIVDAASQAREYRRMFERGSPAMSLSFLKRLRIHELSGTVLGPYGNPKNPKKAVTDDDFVVPAAVAPTCATAPRATGHFPSRSTPDCRRHHRTGRVDESR